MFKTLSFVSLSHKLHKPKTLIVIALPVGKQIHAQQNTKSDNLVNVLSHSFKQGFNWDLLTQKFSTVELNNYVIEQVLLKFKQPADAKRALGFFHWSAKHEGITHSLHSYCITVHILVKAGLILDAKALIESVIKKSLKGSSRLAVVESLLGCYEVVESTPFVFDLLVQGYAKLRLFEIGFDVCCYLEQKGFGLNVASFNSLIHVIQKSDEKCSMVWRVYGHMIRQRVYPNEVTLRIMVDALCKEGLLRKFVDMLERICGKRCSPSVVVNTSLVFRMLEEGEVEGGMVLLKRMLQRNMVVDSVAYSLVVSAKVKSGDISKAWEVCEEMLRRGFQANAFVYGSFVRGYIKEGRVREAIFIMQEMESMSLKPCDETYNCIIEGCAREGRSEESVCYCEKMMESGFVPCCSAFNELAEKLCESGKAGKASLMLTGLLDKGFVPNEVTYSHLIKGYGKEGKIDEILKLYYEMEYKSMPVGLLTFTPLISSLCQYGKLKEAENYINIMKARSLAPDESIYNSLVAGYLTKGDRERARQLYKETVGKGLKPSFLELG